MTRQSLTAPELDVVVLAEGDRMAAQDPQGLGAADGRDLRIDRGRVDLVRARASKPKNDRLGSAVPPPRGAQ